MRYIGIAIISFIFAATGTASAQVPDRLTLQGLGQTAVLSRTGPDTWQWVENGVVFRFRAVTQTPAELVIHDASRDMYHHLNLGTRATAWRIGTTAPWNAHYQIVDMSPGTSQTPVAEQSGCCSWIAPNIGRTCAAGTNRTCAQQSGQFTPNGTCGTVPGGFCAP